MRAVTIVSLADVSIDVSVSNQDALTVRPGGRFRVPVVLTNTGAHTLDWSHQNPLHLAYRWLDEKGKMVERDGLRTIIPVAPLVPGSRVEVEIVGASPEGEGRHQLQLSLVLEGVHWACDIGSAGWVQLTAQVAPAPAWPTELRTSRGARALRGAMAAAELARQIEGRTFAVGPAPNGAVIEGEPIATYPSSIGPGKRRSVLHRLRDWFRRALGVSGLENQLNDVLAHAGRHEQHVRDLETQMLTLRDASRIEVEIANDRARQQAELVDDVGRELKDRLLSLEEASQAQFGDAHQRALRLAEEIAKARDEVLAQIGDVDGNQRRLIATEELNTKRLQDESGRYSEALDRGLAAIHAELRGGSVVVELISNLRQLITWAQAAGNLGVIAEVSETLKQLVEQSGQRALRDAAQRDMLDLQVVGNSLKIDALLTRQTIPLATAGVILVRNRFGLLAIQDDDAPAIAYYSTGDLPEPATVAIVERLLKPGDCFLDVGANVGIYSLIAGRRVGAGGKVIAVEPFPSTMRALRTTLAINGIAPITQAHECALGSANGTATLYSEPTSGHNSLIGSTASTRSSLEVVVKRGDAILDQLKPVLIKIDVEGWELDVLQGLEPVIKANKRLSVVVEFSPEHARRRGMQPDEWLDRLRAFGLTMWVIDDRDISLRRFERASDLGDRGANLFLSRVLPPALKSMVHDR